MQCNVILSQETVKYYKMDMLIEMQEGAKIKQNGEYVFCCSESHPESLVILSRRQKLVQKLVQFQQTVFIWIRPKSPELLKQIQDIKRQLDIAIFSFSSYEEAYQWIRGSGETHIFVICAQQIGDKVLKLQKFSQISGFIFYPINSNEQPENFKIQKVETLSSLIQCLELKRFINQKYKLTPNFVSLDENVWQSNLRIRSIFSMVYQNIDFKTRRIIVEELEKLVLDTYKYQNQCKQTNLNVLKNIVQKLMSRNLTQKEAFQSYVDQTFLYKFVNGMLRCFESPPQLFYMQPYFVDLFNAVWTKFLQQHKNNQFIQFKCWRGGLITQKQADYFLQNKGLFIKNLSFFSSSLNEVAAVSQHMNNVLFTIEVFQSKLNYHYGYAVLGQHSKFGQMQVLFNPLNTFYVKNVERRYDEKKQQVNYYINLVFSDLKNLQFEDEQYKKKKQVLLIHLNQHQKYLKYQCVSQGDALIRYNQLLKGGYQYWAYYLTQAKQFQVQITGLIRMGICENAKKNYAKAIYYQEKCLSLIKNSEKIEPFQQFCLLNNLANSYLYIGDKQRSFTLYKQSIKKSFENLQKMKELSKTDKSNIPGIYILQQNIIKQSINCLKTSTSISELHFHKEKAEIIGSIIKNLYGQKSKFYGLLYLNLAISHINLEMFEQAYQILKNVQNILLNSYGDKHPYYLETLQKLSLVTERLELYQQCQQHLLRRLSNYSMNNEKHWQILVDLGILYRNQQKILESIFRLNASLQLQEKFRLQNTDLYAKTLKQIGTSYSDISFNKSMKLYYTASCLMIKDEQQTQQFIETMKLVAELYTKYGKNKFAFERLFKCFCKQLMWHKQDVNFAITLYMIGKNIVKRKDFKYYNTACLLYDRAYQILVKIEPVPYIYLAQIASLKAHLFIQLYYLYKAKQQFAEHFKLTLKIYGKDHINSKISYYNLRQIGIQIKQFEEEQYQID